MLLHSTSEITDGQEPPRTDHGPIEWVEVHRRLREYARHRASLDAAEAFDLLRAEQLKLHFLCGFAAAARAGVRARSSPLHRAWLPRRATSIFIILYRKLKVARIIYGI